MAGKLAKTVLLTDDQVREARRLHEKEMWSKKALAEKYGTSEPYMYHLLTYTTRTKVI